MKKMILLLGFTFILACCSKGDGVEGRHDISAEFPAQKGFEQVLVTISQDGGVTMSAEGSEVTGVAGCTEYSLRELRIVTGICSDADALLEETFWKNTSAMWIYSVNLENGKDAFENLGFADYLRWKFSETKDHGLFLYTSGNVFDRISSFVRNGGNVQFNVKIEEE